jgi:hypothetical protein
VNQRVPEVEVGAVRLVTELAQLRVTLALGDGDRVDRRVGRAGGLLLLGGHRRLGVELVAGALDRGLDELAVQRAVDDDRPSALNSISTPAALAWSTSSSVNRICGGP